MGKSLKNKEWYVDGKAPLSLGYDAIRLRIGLVIPRVSAFGNVALTQHLTNDSEDGSLVFFYVMA